MINCLPPESLGYFLSLLDPALWDILAAGDGGVYSKIVIHAIQGDVIWEWQPALNEYCVGITS